MMKESTSGKQRVENRFFRQDKPGPETRRLSVRAAIVSASIVIAALSFSIAVQHSFQARALVPTLFVTAVFSVSWFYYEAVGIVCAFALSVCSRYLMHFSFQEFIDIMMVAASALLAVSAAVNEKKLQRRAEQLAEAERMRSNLLRAVSHDLRTPLTTISGSGTMMLENWETLSDAQKIQMLKSITVESEWLSHMTENLLSVTRIDHGDVTVYKKPVVAEELADSVVSRFSRRYPEAAVTVSLGEDFLLIPMDASLVTQVLINLLENAVLHSGGTKIGLSIAASGKKAVFRVEDNGRGLTDELLKTLFIRPIEKERTAPAADGRSGMGIGLTACAAIVKAHGGTIRAENRREGGAAFVFDLPLGEEE